MTSTYRKMATIIAISAVAGTMALVPATASFAATPSSTVHHTSRVAASAAPSVGFTASTALVSAKAQAADEQTVATFSASHVLPSLPVTHTAAQESAFMSALTAYWKATPWDAVAGQWGCTVQQVSVTQDADASGVVTPTLSEVTNCGPNLQAADLLNSSGAVTRTSTLKALAAKTPDAAAAPATTLNHCGSTNDVKNCLTAVILSTIKASSTWNSEEQTSGRVRLGKGAGTGSSCSAGTLVAYSPTTVLGFGSTVSVTKPMTVDSNWSARFYNPDFYGGTCMTA